VSDLDYTCVCEAKAWVEVGYFLDQVTVAGSWYERDDDGYPTERHGDVPATHQIFFFICAHCGRRMLVDALGLLGYDTERSTSEATFHRRKPDPVPTQPHQKESR
jgi:hypothetical protein